MMARQDIPNALTCLRLALAVVFFGMLSVWSLEAASVHNDDSRPEAVGSLDTRLMVAAVLFIVAAATDALDGALARRWQVISVFGRVMDPLADKLLVLGAFVLLAGPAFSDVQRWLLSVEAAPAEGGASPEIAASHAGVLIRQASHVYPWMVVIILARELLVTSLRSVFEARGVDFSATASGKLKMALQSACVPLVLFVVAVRDAASPATLDILDTTARLAVWLTVAVTAWSGVPYVMRAVRLSSASSGASLSAPGTGLPVEPAPLEPKAGPP